MLNDDFKRKLEESGKTIKNCFKELEKSVLPIADKIKQLGILESTYLGKNSSLNELTKQMKNLSADEKPIVGKMINDMRNQVEVLSNILDSAFEKQFINEKLKSEKIDVTLDKPAREKGSLHPISIDLIRMAEILTGLGFSQIDGPEMELDKYNFELVNVPKDHPARDMQDTYYITNDILLRTQTSNTQPRAMQVIKPPFKVFSAGRVFRKDEIDATHTPAFYQVEGIYIDEKVSMADLKNTIELVLRKYLGENVKTRFRASFFPFTEPSVEVDATCNICNGKGCSACKNTGCYEILGAGMIHPHVLELNGIDSFKYSGYAFGFGFDRFPKMRYKIPFARMMFEHDVRFLKQFK